MIFSIFGKKNRSKKSSAADPGSAQDSPPTTPGLTTNSGVDFANSIMAQRHLARATERKIDAIEYEMSRDILKKDAAKKPGPGSARNATAQRTDANANLFDNDSYRNSILFRNSEHFETTLALTGATSDFLLQGNIEDHVALTATENIPALEEAAILFANQQSDAAELILQNLIRNENYSALNPSAWLMLFDLYQITNNQVKFEQLSLEYVRKLEISAPVWRDDATPVLPQKEHKAFVPGISFSGKLDAQISTQIDKLQALSRQHAQMRLEFVRITELDVAGCEQILKGFQILKKSEQELTVVGAEDLIHFTSSLIAVGRRDASDAPWLLLLELLQLTNDEPRFEEISLDYCITYEVSPPSFEAQKNKSSEPSVGISIEFIEADRYLLPNVIEGDTQELIKQISIFALNHHSVRLDCSRLNRIDFSSCGRLLSGLLPLSKQLNVSIEFHDVNQLVTVLLNAMGFKNIALIFPRKH